MSNKDKHQVVLRDHTFDGIQEFDQKLPNWWLFTLYIMIVAFVVFWVAYYQLPLGLKSDVEKIDQAVAFVEQKRQQQLEEVIASLDNDSLLAMAKEGEHVTAGEAVYQSKCMACHGPDLSGMMAGLKLPGVSLVDAEWKYGAAPLEIMKLVTNGSPDLASGMIAWKTQLAPTEIAQVVAYILSKQDGAG